MKYTKEKLQDAVNHSQSYNEVIRYLGSNISGGLHAHIKRRIKTFNIDTTHFVGKRSSFGKPSKIRCKPNEVLILRTSGVRKEAYLLRNALIESGIDYICSICKNNDVWMNSKLTLQVDHVNGNCIDDRKENLRFLCPNCHSQTKNYCGNKNKKIM